jgi:RNA polymerase sigma-70 factor (ECF subfamily)
MTTSELARFETLYRENVDAVTRFAARRCTSPDEVADLVAVVFLRVIESWPRYDPRRGDPRPWIFGIAANCVAEQRRDAARGRALVSSLRGRRLLEPDDYERLEGRIDAERLEPALEAALSTLGARERLVLELVDVEGRPPSEAAAAVGTTGAAARMRLTRARRHLRRALAESPAAVPATQPKGVLR